MSYDYTREEIAKLLDELYFKGAMEKSLKETKVKPKTVPLEDLLEKEWEELDG